MSDSVVIIRDLHLLALRRKAIHRTARALSKPRFAIETQKTILISRTAAEAVAFGKVVTRFRADDAAAL